MNLPHTEPLIFAKRVLKKQKNEAVVECEFKTPPSLAFFLEAAAQASIALGEFPEEKIGFLSAAKDIKQLQDLSELNYNILVKNEIEVANMKKISFEAYAKESSAVCVSGVLTIVVEK